MQRVRLRRNAKHTRGSVSNMIQRLSSAVSSSSKFPRQIFTLTWFLYRDSIFRVCAQRSTFHHAKLVCWTSSQDQDIRGCSSFIFRNSDSLRVRNTTKYLFLHRLDILPVKHCNEWASVNWDWLLWTTVLLRSDDRLFSVPHRDNLCWYSFTGTWDCLSDWGLHNAAWLWLSSFWWGIPTNLSYVKMVKTIA